VLVLTASVGAGHDIPAQWLKRGLLARRPDAEVEIVDALDVMGPLVHKVAEDAMRRTFGGDRLHWVFDAQYLLFARTAPLRALGQAVLYRSAGGRLLAEIARRSPDVVVSVYPAATEVLGRLRRAGRLRTPAVGAITDLSSLWYWASRGVDLHLVTHPESLVEVNRIAGPGRAEPVRGLYDERFLDPPPQGAARRALDLPHDGPMIVVSGGGWGVGDLVGAVEVGREQPGATVLALTGDNEAVRRRLEERQLGPAVRVLPFVDDMSTLLAASDVVVHSTAGLTVLEALLVGCRPVSYGWGIAHIRMNDRAYRRFGLARVARSRDELRRAITLAVGDGREPLASRFARLPHAADLVLELAG
jgi:UDP-N-acetylglucosamine:LPS N-acetylglucosamine transferase